jgi:alpha,alpha-trehalase
MRLNNGSLRNFALELNQIWPDLTRKTARYVEEMPDRYAYIYVPNNHIVPGGNFTSFYYWYDFGS